MPKEIEKLNNLQAVFTVSYCIYILEILPHAADMSSGFFPFPLLSFPSHPWKRGATWGILRCFSWTLKILEPQRNASEKRFVMCQSKAVVKVYYFEMALSVSAAESC